MTLLHRLSLSCSILAATLACTATFTLPADASPGCGCNTGFARPSDGAKNVPLNVRPFISFHGLDRGSIELVRTSDEAALEIEVDQAGSLEDQVFVVPVAALEPNERYLITFEVLDDAGEEEPQIVGQVFTTGLVGDDIAPEVGGATITPDAENIQGACDVYVAAGVLLEAPSDDLTPAEDLLIRVELEDPSATIFLEPLNPNLGRFDSPSACLDNVPDAEGGETATGTVVVVDWAGNASEEKVSEFAFREGGSACLCSAVGASRAPAWTASLGALIALACVVRRRQRAVR